MSIGIVQGFCGEQMGFRFVKPAKKGIGRTHTLVSAISKSEFCSRLSQSEETFSQSARLGEMPSDQMEYP